MGSYSAHPGNYAKEFQYLAQAYDLTWHDLHVVQTTTLTPEEGESIQAATREHANQVHLTDAAVPVGAQAMARAPQPHGHCLIAGTLAASNKAINYDKLQEIIQNPDENPAVFLNRLTEALTQYTHLDPVSPAGATVLATHFISRSSPNIHKKGKKSEEGPQTPIPDLVKMAFKVFNTREEAAELKRQARLQPKVQLQAPALVAALQPASFGSPQKEGINRTLPWASFKCGTKGHWAHQCPNPKEPTRPCPQCQMMGHWKSDCPGLGGSSAPPHGGNPELANPAFQLLGLDND
ncbi:unnamed protein product [Nyctereutes procyonoides]|uniref:(raccoon dog) hypothetical protein n=1 Tax=Nyctereutes procyonoides TaxID=34880 RepID=A0A811ZNR8_NYCPR|nr:unnamed protein product [Nyctereutes procyonoides]